MSADDKIEKVKKLREETEEEYLSFINTTFKHASIKSELKSLSEGFLADYYKDKEKREKLTFNQGMQLYIALHKQDNEFSSAVLNAISKKSDEPGLSAIAKLLGITGSEETKKEKEITPPLSAESTESIKKVVSLVDEIKELGKSEKPK